MEMDGRDSAEYQFWLKRDIMVILEFDFKSLKDKIVYSIVSPIQKETKKREMGRGELVVKRKMEFLIF